MQKKEKGKKHILMTNNREKAEKKEEHKLIHIQRIS